MRLTKTQLFCLVTKLRKPQAVQRLVCYKKLREVSVSYFSRANNYAVVMAFDLVKLMIRAAIIRVINQTSVKNETIKMSMDIYYCVNGHLLLCPVKTL